MTTRWLARLPTPFLAAGTALCVLASQAAWAAKASGMGGSAEGTFIAEIIVLLLVGRGLGEILQRYGQPAIMGQLIGGILLGPSLFGVVWPSAQHLVFNPDQKSMMDAVSQLGILMLLLLTGMETDLKLVRRVGAACFAISATGVVVPFVCGFVLAQFLPDSLLPNPAARVVAGLFLGTALSISSVKIVAMVIREMNFMRRNLGQVIVSSAIIEDTIGWLIIAITFGIATTGRIELVALTKTIAGVALFMAFSFTIGRRIVFTLIRWTNDTFRSEYPVVTMILIIMGTMALITNAIGVHTVLGAFVAGILVGESPILSRHVESQLRGIITALFMPIFFGMAGLGANLTVLADPTLAFLTAGLVLIASVGKFSGAFLGGRLSGMTLRESIAIGSAMNARGSTEVIVATIGLSMGVLSHNLFTMIVTMAIVTTLVMPPMLRWALRRIPLREDEKQRVERESLDVTGYIAQMERLLLAADDSAIGRFASYLAGLVSGANGMPTTLLQFNEPKAGRDFGEGTEAHLDEIKKGAKASASYVKEVEDKAVDKVHLTARVESKTPKEAVADEARKGYDLLLIGMKDSTTPEGAFTSRIEDLIDSYSGGFALVCPGKGEVKMPELDGSSKILVPINGTEVSRRAAEFAFALARPKRARVLALYVTRQTNARRPTISRRREEAVLKEIADLADRYDVLLQTAIRVTKAADVAICQEAARGVTMIVMGVSQRPGEELYFGNTASAVLSKCRGPILLLATERTKRAEIAVTPDGTSPPETKTDKAAA
jgi:Kef-type K+ transport system membrane component KefB/nucleotide-binding universal stress UspA family protein